MDQKRKANFLEDHHAQKSNAGL
uniref:Uncharacterized protein n=1 Tax=Anguilla anguilla TaxID=7936 RepID=A0A0E9XZJ6_ANGAN